MYIFPLLGMNCSLRKHEPPWMPDTCRMESFRDQILFFFNNLASFLASLFPCWTVSELSQCYLHPAHSLIRGAQRNKRSLFGFFGPFSATALHSWIVVFSLWRKGSRRCQRHYLALIKADKPGWPLSCWVRGWGGGLCVLMTHCPQTLLSNHRKRSSRGLIQSIFRETFPSVSSLQERVTSSCFWKSKPVWTQQASTPPLILQNIKGHVRGWPLRCWGV